MIRAGGAVDWFMKEKRNSQRRACALAGIAPCKHRRRSKRPADTELRASDHWHPWPSSPWCRGFYELTLTSDRSTQAAHHHTPAQMPCGERRNGSVFAGTGRGPAGPPAHPVRRSQARLPTRRTPFEEHTELASARTTTPRRSTSPFGQPNSRSQQNPVAGDPGLAGPRP